MTENAFNLGSHDKQRPSNHQNANPTKDVEGKPCHQCFTFLRSTIHCQCEARNDSSLSLVADCNHNNCFLRATKQTKKQQGIPQQFTIQRAEQSLTNCQRKKNSKVSSQSQPDNLIDVTRGKSKVSACASKTALDRLEMTGSSVTIF